MFKKRTSIKQVEEGKYLSPKFNKDGLIPVITTDYKTKEVLMHGFMNKLALQKTIEIIENICCTCSPICGRQRYLAYITLA